MNFSICLLRLSGRQLLSSLDALRGLSVFPLQGFFVLLLDLILKYSESVHIYFGSFSLRDISSYALRILRKKRGGAVSEVRVFWSLYIMDYTYDGVYSG